MLFWLSGRETQHHLRNFIELLDASLLPKSFWAYRSWMLDVWLTDYKAYNSFKENVWSSRWISRCIASYCSTSALKVSLSSSSLLNCDSHADQWWLIILVAIHLKLARFSPTVVLCWAIKTKFKGDNVQYATHYEQKRFMTGYLSKSAHCSILRPKSRNFRRQWVIHNILTDSHSM